MIGGMVTAFMTRIRSFHIGSAQKIVYTDVIEIGKSTGEKKSLSGNGMIWIKCYLQTVVMSAAKGIEMSDNIMVALIDLYEPNDSSNTATEENYMKFVRKVLAISPLFV